MVAEQMAYFGIDRNSEFGAALGRIAERLYDSQADLESLWADVLGAPRGGVEYAHKLTNTGKGPLKYLSISTKSDIEVCEYPDSGKFMVQSSVAAGGAGKLRYIGREESSLDYWVGEDSAD